MQIQRVLTSAFCVFSCSAMIQAQDRAPRRYALVVGVQQYRPQQDLPTLPYTERDADRMAAVLTDKGFQVTAGWHWRT